jgi:L-fuconate dehydratase
MFKQFFQAGAIDVCQVDVCRLGGVNEVLAVLLMAAKFGVPVCPHAGGVGLPELVRHISIFDYVRISGDLRGRMIEYTDHLHEHFLDPAVIRDGRYVAPSRPGSSAEMRRASLQRYTYAGAAAGSHAPRRTDSGPLGGRRLLP